MNIAADEFPAVPLILKTIFFGATHAAALLLFTKTLNSVLSLATTWTLAWALILGAAPWSIALFGLPNPHPKVGNLIHGACLAALLSSLATLLICDLPRLLGRNRPRR